MVPYRIDRLWLQLLRNRTTYDKRSYAEMGRSVTPVLNTCKITRLMNPEYAGSFHFAVV